MNLKERKEMFSSTRDIGMKLNDTYLNYNGKYYYCSVSENSGKLHLFENAGRDGSPKKITDVFDEGISFIFPKLGYFNYKDDVKYVSRSATRTTKIALCTRQLSEYDHQGQPARNNSFNYLNFIERNKMFLDVSYHTIKKAIERLDKTKNTSIALDRNNCIYRDEMDMLKLVHKNTIIGWVKDGTKPTLVIPESRAKRKAIYERCIQMPVEVLNNV